MKKYVAFLDILAFKNKMKKIPRRKVRYNRRSKLNLGCHTVRDNSGKTTALIRGTGPGR